MTWTSDDRRWMKHLHAYVTNADPLEPEYVGFFNAGQKIYFWAIAGSAVLFVVTGVPMWFPRTFAGIPLQFGYLVHDITFILFAMLIIIHVYLGTVAEPGTFVSMTRGTVTRAWARLHHPRWYREVTGEEPHPPRQHV